MRSIIHFIMATSFFTLLVTALTAEFLFSKEAIMESFEFSLSQIGVAITPVDQLYVARLLRRTTWWYHFIAGIGLSVFFVVFTVMLHKVKKRISLFHKLLGIQIVIMGVTGTLIQYRYRGWIREEWIDLLRDIHQACTYVIVGTVIYHLIIVYKTHKGSRNVK